MDIVPGGPTPPSSSEYEFFVSEAPVSRSKPADPGVAVTRSLTPPSRRILAAGGVFVVVVGVVFAFVIGRSSTPAHASPTSPGSTSTLATGVANTAVPLPAPGAVQQLPTAVVQSATPVATVTVTPTVAPTVAPTVDVCSKVDADRTSVVLAVNDWFANRSVQGDVASRLNTPMIDLEQIGAADASGVGTAVTNYAHAVSQLQGDFAAGNGPLSTDAEVSSAEAGVPGC